MATKIGDFDAGVASFQSEEFYNTELFSGSAPNYMTDGPFTVPQNTDWPAFAVVGVSGGVLALANYLGAIGDEGSDVAQGQMTFTTPPDEDDTFTIGTQVYTWKDVPAAAYEVKTGATNTLAADAMVVAINAAADDPLTLFGDGTEEHPDVYAVKVDADNVKVYAKVTGEAGNAIATTQVGDESAWGAAVLQGGEGVGIRPIGITTVPVVTGAGVEASIHLGRAGCFNPDALYWDASFDADAKKKVAFEGAPTPTNIVIRKIAHTNVYA